eukprot:1158485-Pelagomonas_calceolata.AAC.14
MDHWAVLRLLGKGSVCEKKKKDCPSLKSVASIKESKVARRIAPLVVVVVHEVECACCYG